MRPVTRACVFLTLCCLAACRQADGPLQAGEDAAASPAAASAPGTTAPAATGLAPARAAVGGSDPGPRTAGEIDFPTIPRIVVPEIVGIGPAQRALESSMQGVLDPMAGVSVRPARCDGGGALLGDAGITSVDADGNLLRNGDEGIFRIAADGTGTANYGGGIITVNADGSGTINGSGEDGADDAIIRVEADGSGTYNGRYGIISLDGRGAGTWNGDSGLVSNAGDGSGTWNGPQGIVRVESDGSGTWNGPHGLIVNHGDGTGRVGTPSRDVAMAPIPKLAPEGRFPPLRRFAPPGAPCGYVVTLADQELFDFDRAEIRADAAQVLDVLGAALARVESRRMEVGGHTDAKGSDAYNQALSERRAQAVVDALRQRGVATDMDATGHGEAKPVAPNEIGGQDHPAGRQLNRRVEIFVRT